MSCDFREGDCRAVLAAMPERSVQCVVTSPPYFGLRDYGVSGQVGLEATPDEYVRQVVDIFRAVRRVLRDDGTLWLNLGDSYGDKNLLGVPWRVALALQADGWYLRADIIWHKPNPMPESVRDRPVKAHEYLFLLAKSPRYYYDIEAVKEPCKPASLTRAAAGYYHHAKHDAIIASQGDRCRTRLGLAGGHRGAATANKRSVWTVPPKCYKGAHFATFPPALVEPCVKAGTSERGCCAACGAPWRRVVERRREATRPALDNKTDETGMANRDPRRHCTVTETAGWEPGCECGGEAVPCTVLDPFSGAGTSGLVARRLGRKYIGIELNPAYNTLAKERLAKEAP